MEGEDATLLAEAQRMDEGLLHPQTFCTDGIYLSDQCLAEIAANPSKYLNIASRHGGNEKRNTVGAANAKG